MDRNKNVLDIMIQLLRMMMGPDDRVHHGTNVLRLNKEKRNFKMSQCIVEYTLVCHKGNLGYIATSNLVYSTVATTLVPNGILIM